MTDVLKIISCATVVAACAIGSNLVCAQNQEPATGIQWKCVQQRDEDFNILCVPRRIRVEQGGPATVPMPGALGGGGALDGDSSQAGLINSYQGRDVRPVALRGFGEVFSTSAWILPLYSSPSSALAVMRLLETVLCGTVRTCNVTYDIG